MIKAWIDKALNFLEHSLKPIPHELNEIDWKEELTPDLKRVAKHLSAFSNQPGGGFVVFGIEDKTAKLIGVTQKQAADIIQKVSSIGRDTLSPMVVIDHAIENYEKVPLLFVFVKESAVKPVHLTSGSIEDAYIHSGGTTRQASRQEVGGLMLNSKTPQFEELHASKLKTGTDILNQIDYKTIYTLLNKPTPQSNSDILNWMKEEKMVDEIDGAGFYITNFGALSAAQNLMD